MEVQAPKELLGRAPRPCASAGRLQEERRRVSRVGRGLRRAQGAMFTAPSGPLLGLHSLVDGTFSGAVTKSSVDSTQGIRAPTPPGGAGVTTVTWRKGRRQRVGAEGQGLSSALLAAQRSCGRRRQGGLWLVFLGPAKACLAGPGPVAPPAQWWCGGHLGLGRHLCDPGFYPIGAQCRAASPSGAAEATVGSCAPLPPLHTPARV